MKAPLLIILVWNLAILCLFVDIYGFMTHVGITVSLFGLGNIPVPIMSIGFVLIMLIAYKDYEVKVRDEVIKRAK